jgi:poly-gamma-glutamate capsule biosynthesis protein CapA/YwtB (metallophosphatase superfamily)
MRWPPWCRTRPTLLVRTTPLLGDTSQGTAIVERFRALFVHRIVKLTLAVVAASLTVAVLVGAVFGRDDADRAQSGAVATKQERPAGRPVVLAFAGDVHFEGPIGTELSSAPNLLLASISPVLRSADLAVVNLETAITTQGTPTAKTFVFRAPPSAFAALSAGGVDVASMANNHGLDYGEAGLRDSLAAARHYRFPVVGIGLNAEQAYRPFRRTIKGQRMALIGATQVLDDELISAWTAGPGKPGLASAKDVPRLVQAVRKARATSDTVIVFLHWGIELQQCPSPDQRTLAKRLVAAGADVVVGGHAHRVQGAGRMGKALVGYGLGNFVWYGTSELSTETGVLLVTVDGRKVLGYRWEPARIVDGTPRPLAGSERRAQIASWQSLRGCTGLRK